MTAPTFSHELSVASALAREAGALLLAHLRAGFTVEHKTSADDPVTVADREASTLIMTALAAAFPADGLLSEEETDDRARLGHDRVWIVDPIDGTREYSTGLPDYCVSIGLAVGGEPVLGVVYAPETDELFSGVVGQGAFLNGQPVPAPGSGPDWRIAVSDTEHGRELHRTSLPGMKPSGSIALKLARIAAGQVDATFTMSPRSEWDIAAGHALLRAAGGDLRRRDGRPVRYNQPRPHIEQGLIGGAPAALAWLEGQLSGHRLPVAHLGLTPADPAWTLLPETDRAALDGHPGVNVRHASGEVLALLVVNPGTRQVERAEGDAFHLDRLTRDVTRALGTVQS
ncbi:3'(2'),5'-bisphosphate nucleotidase CysQ [Deinococcus xianganensis]|uniref:3'(2'),5'-bisphosphate nucleotidase CysQ n=1 Tax=Deinococcus xianganensis TaxID=1507289 RepID=A0A6I4YHU7_9DEIO|nr:3'(2'),5'-bisphosphate nucleotidase CysQ [Deinococcus xianganensis]MXV19596.1 3'(2'),5'-bisphosphate nucleotidase CysQ [Deinococcus xianganensis]